MMLPIIEKITPEFIRSYNQYLLKNAPMGWQLQLPTITWIWFLITLVTVPITFLLPLDNSGNSDMIAIILISVLTAVFLGFLFVYLLIQFNNTKSFGTRVLFNGAKEQLAYLYVFLLCMMHIVFYPTIIDIRKGNLMTVEEIKNEAIIFNKGSFYFMGDSDAHRYFPTEKSFFKYKFFNEYEKGTNTNGYNNETYYIEVLKPQMKAYFIKDTIDIDAKWNRKVAAAPKLYSIEEITIPEEYSEKNTYGLYDSDEGYDNSVDYYMPDVHIKKDRYYYEKYQFAVVSDAERLKDIRNFLSLYKRYHSDLDNLHFDTEDDILQKYFSNRFSATMHENYGEVDNNNTVVDVVSEAALQDIRIDTYLIEKVHSTIADSKFKKLKNILFRSVIVFHVALVLAVLLFMFKNTRLRELILMFVYTGLITLAVIVLTVIIFNEEIFALHVVIALFLCGIYFSFLDRRTKQFNSTKTVLILLSNAVFAYAPIFFYFYFFEYLELGKISEDIICISQPLVCKAHETLMEQLFYGALWGGILFYLLVGSTLYKKVYERNCALPFNK